MKKNTFKKAISLLTASLMAAMCVTAFPVSAVESYAEPDPLYELSTTTTTTIAECYETVVEYDSSPLPVYHELPVRFYNSATGTATNAQIMEVSDNIDYVYEEGSDTVYIYTLAPGEAKMYILAEGCAFGAYVTFTVTDSGSQSTGTTSTSITTTTTAAYTTTLQQRLAFYFDAPKDTITVGEEMSVKLYSTFKAEYWSKNELPEHYVNDPSIAAVEIGEEVGTFKITGLSAGSTFVRFIEEGYADFRITVAEDGTVTTTTTETTDLFTTTTGYGIQLACSEENVTLYPGHTQNFYLYYKTGPTSFSESYPVTFEFENEGIAAVTPDPYGGVSDYVIEALAEGTTKLTIKQQYGYTTLTCEMNITVQPQTTTTAPITDVPSETTYITTAAPALLCSPSAVTVEVGKRQPVILNFSNGSAIKTNCEAFESDNAAVAAAEQGEYSYICYVEGISEGTANITITPPYDYDPVTIPVTVVPADDDNSNDVSVHIVVNDIFYNMLPKGDELDLESGSYSVFKHDGTSTSMEKVLSKVSMSAETENVTIDTSAFDNTAPGYYDVIITYADEDGYTDTVTLCAAVYYFDWMDTTTTTTATTTTSITSYISTPDCDSTPIETTTTTTAYTSATVHTTTITDLTTPESSAVPTQTTTTPALGIMFEASEIEIEAGQCKSFSNLKFTDGRPYTGAIASFSSDNPAVAVASSADYPQGFYIVGMSEGTATITINDPIFDSSTTIKVIVTGTYEDDEFGGGIDIEIHSLPDKLTYNVGEELDLTGGEYSIIRLGTVENMTVKDHMSMTTDVNWMITDAFDSSTPGTYPIIIYFSYYDGSWGVYRFNVTVNDPNAEAEKGDINQDGTVGIDDATAVLDYYAKTAAGIDTAAIADADIDGDGNITMSDATYILTYYAMTSAGLPCTWEDVITG